MVAVAITAIVAALLAGFGLWVRKLYQERDQVPELRASLKVTADRRDELAAELALERSARAADRVALDKATSAITEIAAQLRKETDDRIEASPDDGGAQQRISDELLGRPWPQGHRAAAGAGGDRAGGAGEAVQPAGAAGAAQRPGR